MNGEKGGADMEKVNPVELIKKLKTGETPVCPVCGKGTISTKHDPKISHFFSCNNCKFTINID